MVDLIGARATRVLLAVVAGVQTRRDLAVVSGVSSTSTVTHHLEVLRRLGLVSWERDRDGTLRSLVALRPLDELSPVERVELDREVRDDRTRDAAGMD
jgi:DNA-binding transcriptional ArsR family regulator